MRWWIAMILLLGMYCKAAEIQDTLSYTRGDHVLKYVIVEGDTVLLSQIQELKIYRRPVFSSKWQQRKYNRYVANVKKVYPSYNFV